MSVRTLGGVVSLIVLFGLASTAQAIGPIVSLSISPPAGTVVAGTTQPFTVQGQDADGAATDLTTNSAFITTDPRGFMTANVYTAGTAGSWTVTATYAALTAEAKVTVTPGAVTDLIVNPNSQPEYLTNGQARTFTVEAFDAFNNPVSGFSAQWSVEGKIGTITAVNATSAKFTATDMGKGRVVARNSAETAFIDVSVAKGEQPVNANANLNANANTNAAAANTNATNQNVNSQTNDNTNSQTATVNANTNAATTPASCTAWPRSAWVWLYLAYLVLLIGSLAALRSRRPAWWWLLPLILTIIALWLYFQYRCGIPVYPGLPYLILLTAIVGASWFTWQRGKPQGLQ